MAPVSLREIAEALQQATDGFVQAVNRETGELVEWTPEMGDEVEDPRDDPRCELLPESSELPGWTLLRDFAESRSGRARDALRDAIRGRGAFRAFRATVDRLDLTDAWYAFRDAAYAAFAREWLEEVDLAFVDDVRTPAEPARPAMAPRLSFVTLGVSDLERSTAFYRDVLGLPQLPTPPGVAFFELGETWLSLFPRAELAADAGVADDGRGFAGVTLAHNVGDPADVDALIAHVAAKGARIVRAPSRADWGGYTAYFADPDGYLWEVAYNPAFPHV